MTVTELPPTPGSGAVSQPAFAAAPGTVVLPNQVTTREQYFKARRTGRGVPLNRSRRQAVWDVVQTYHAGAAADGSTDFDEKAALAARVLGMRPESRPVRPPKASAFWFPPARTPNLCNAHWMTAASPPRSSTEIAPAHPARPW